MLHVVPCIGTWIEIGILAPEPDEAEVVPCIGTWIEISPSLKK